ncbi:MAG: TAT-variant-translocated molybdopterin oxidoreductase [Planctomycetes bacterium]|nr:TAT-variant-translocated molybdopterin oxidoreductase [Planctomycetota bacterium]
MSHIDQCPSTIKEGKPAPAEIPFSAREVSRATGKAYWRSLDDLAGTSQFRDFLHREFPAHASELLDGSRRQFLRLMGASIALAGAATIPGCRQPDHKILAYNTDPEYIVPGKPLFYATAMPTRGGGCQGLLAETFEGRPTKLEGNPLHPFNRGKSDWIAQGAILDLYDPDRDPAEVASRGSRSGQAVTIAEFGAFANAAKAWGADTKIAFLVEKATSPARDDMKARLLKKFPGAKWFAYDGYDNEGALAGSVAAFGAAHVAQHDLSNANVLVSFDCDFLHSESTLPIARTYAAGRFRKGAKAGHAAAETQMSRLYVVESSMTPTGGAADHRWSMKASRIGAFAVALAAKVMDGLGAAAPADLKGAVAKAAAGVTGEDLPAADHVQAIADDLLASGNRGASVVFAGASQPAEVHALAHALNAALGNVGKTVSYAKATGDAAMSSDASVRALSAAIDSGEVTAVVIVGSNPVYTAPAGMDFAAKLAKCAVSVYVGDADETAASVKWYLARAHFLEAWGDVTTWQGQYSVVQPMIKPLFGGHSDLEVLGAILGDGVTDGYEIVRRAFAARNGGVMNEKAWRKGLHDGVFNAEGVLATPALNSGAVASAVAKIPTDAGSGGGTEVVVLASPMVLDGRCANNGWLQELPHPVTKVTWDNPALISKKTADKLGVSVNRHLDDPKYNKAQVISVTVGGKTLNIPAWVQPGVADDTVILHAGYGRRVGGRVATGTGFDVNALRTGASPVLAGASVAKAEDADLYPIACTQDHWTMEGRDILREIDLDAWKAHGDTDFSKDHRQTDPYDNSRDLNLAGLMAGAMEGHTPANLNLYRKGTGQPLRGQEHSWIKVDEKGNPVRDGRGRVQGGENKHGKRLQQWGMTIDLTTCTGCSACTIACQAENNIPVVGKDEVSKGRDMAWIRVDRYYASSPTDPYGYTGSPDMVFQPVACVHCENAPCEVVCPVNATVHDPHGTNNMAYNRCIGTKYCSNNCPYKVRRFNWFDYGTKQYKGGWGQVGAPLAGKAPLPENENWVPPRLRAKNREVQNLQKNPHVTVRSRGVMEKCSYCIQRVNAASVETKVSDLKFIPDGFVQTACQQACPTNAIVFGDIYDYESNDGAGSEVSRTRNDPRSYGLLAYLNTRPRTSHMVRVRNPNPKIRVPRADPFGGHGSHGGGHGGGHGGDHGDGHGDGHGGHTEAKPAGHLMSLPVINSKPIVTAGAVVTNPSAGALA